MPGDKTNHIEPAPLGGNTTPMPLTIDDIKLLAGTMEDRLLNRYLLTYLRDGSLPEDVFLEYLELTQGDINDILNS